MIQKGKSFFFILAYKKTKVNLFWKIVYKNGAKKTVTDAKINDEEISPSALGGGYRYYSVSSELKMGREMNYMC